jgi:uncharacterized membrane protein
VPAPHPYESIRPEDVERGRLLACIAYLPALCFVGLAGMPENRFVAFHARQGFLLLCLEAVVLAAMWIFDASLGRIPILGLLLGAVLRFVLGMGLLAATVYGIIKASGGEMTRIPALGDFIERVPF